MIPVRVRLVYEFVMNLPLDEEAAYAAPVGKRDTRIAEQMDYWRDDPHSALDHWYDDEQGTSEIAIEELR